MHKRLVIFLIVSSKLSPCASKGIVVERDKAEHDFPVTSDIPYSKITFESHEDRPPSCDDSSSNAETMPGLHTASYNVRIFPVSEEFFKFTICISAKSGPKDVRSFQTWINQVNTISNSAPFDVVVPALLTIYPEKESVGIMLPVVGKAPALEISPNQQDCRQPWPVRIPASNLECPLEMKTALNGRIIEVLDWGRQSNAPSYFTGATVNGRAAGQSGQGSLAKFLNTEKANLRVFVSFWPALVELLFSQKPESSYELALSFPYRLRGSAMPRSAEINLHIIFEAHPLLFFLFSALGCLLGILLRSILLHEPSFHQYSQLMAEIFFALILWWGLSSFSGEITIYGYHLNTSRPPAAFFAGFVVGVLKAAWCLQQFIEWMKEHAKLLKLGGAK